MADFDFTPKPHEEAAALIRDKPIVTREVFDQMLPEIRGRAFTITGVEGANVLQRARDIIADLPKGETWDDSKSRLIEELSPYLGEGADRRAELLLRTHGFQAFQASNWRVAQEDEDTTHLQYLATEDDRVRDSHLALNGLILPKDDPFWAKHFPPWEWGCRCRVRPMNPDFVEEARQEDESRSPDDRLVMEGPALERLRNGQLQRDGRAYDVTPPSDGPGGDDAFQWHPDNLRLPLDELAQRYDPEVWSAFEENMKTSELARGRSVWDWLSGQRVTPIEKRMAPAPAGLPSAARPSDSAPRTPFEHAEARRAAMQRAGKDRPATERTNSEDVQKAEENWKPREVAASEIAEMRRVLDDAWDQPLPTVEQELSEIQSGSITARLPPSKQIELARINVQEAVAMRDHEARADIYRRENPLGNRSEAIASWSLEQRRKIIEVFRSAREKLLA